MDTAVETRISRHRLEDLHRLAAKAEKGGSRILHVAGTDGHVATSASSPVCYAVSVNGCSCKGFAVHARCGHWALLLSELGQLPDQQEDVLLDEQHSQRCRVCRGEGYARSYVGGGLADWVVSPCSCRQHAA